MAVNYVHPVPGKRLRRPKMFEIGSLCLKIAGRDAGKRCVVIEVLDKNNVMIAGETRRRKCSIRHLEPMNKVLKIKPKATEQELLPILKKEGLVPKITKPKPKQEKPKKLRKKKVKPVKKKVAKKETKKTETNKQETNKQETKTPKKEEKPSLKQENKPEPKK